MEILTQKQFSIKSILVFDIGNSKEINFRYKQFSLNIYIGKFYTPYNFQNSFTHTELFITL